LNTVPSEYGTYNPLDVILHKWFALNYISRMFRKDKSWMKDRG